MNRILLLILVAGITFLVVLLISRADLVKDIWLWLVGLAGPIVKLTDAVITKMRSFFVKDPNEQKTKNANPGSEVTNEQ